MFGERLREERIERGLSQMELAMAVRVSKGIISLWENGLREPTLCNLVALADYFEITLDELVGRNGA